MATLLHPYIVFTHLNPQLSVNWGRSLFGTVFVPGTVLTTTR
jgi:hypothetical protein